MMVRAPVAQLAEATDSKPVQCEFESHLGHRTSRGWAASQQDFAKRAGIGETVLRR